MSLLGSIWAESEGEGLGCTFRMELTPLALDMSSQSDSGRMTVNQIKFITIEYNGEGKGKGEGG